jgi:hypothetical protein
MSRISEQGQTPSEEAADDLHRREARGQDEYHRQRAAVPVTRVHLVVVFVMAHGTILSPHYCHGWFAEGGYRPVVLALRQPDAEDNLGCAEKAHQVRVLGEEACDIADP